MREMKFRILLFSMLSAVARAQAGRDPQGRMRCKLFDSISVSSKIGEKRLDLRIYDMKDVVLLIFYHNPIAN